MKIVQFSSSGKNGLITLPRTEVEAYKGLSRGSVLKRGNVGEFCVHRPSEECATNA